MSTQSLMSRARELTRERVGAALVIVPLATAVPASADTIQFYNPISGSVTSTSGGGLFGHATGVAQPDQTAAQLEGDTIPTPMNTAFLTAGNAATNGDASVATLQPPIPIIFNWQGNLAPGSTSVPGTTIGIDYIFNMLAIPSASYTPHNFGDLYWSLSVQVIDVDYNLMGSFSTLQSGPYTGLSNFVAGHGDLILTTAGAPDQFFATLTVKWDLPKTRFTDADPPYYKADYPDDQLSFTSSIRLSNAGVSELPTPPSAPLPSIVWAGAIMMGLWGTGWGWRQARLRVAP